MSIILMEVFRLENLEDLVGLQIRDREITLEFIQEFMGEHPEVSAVAIRGYTTKPDVNGLQFTSWEAAVEGSADPEMPGRIVLHENATADQVREALDREVLIRTTEDVRKLNETHYVDVYFNGVTRETLNDFVLEEDVMVDGENAREFISDNWGNSDKITLNAFSRDGVVRFSMSDDELSFMDYMFRNIDPSEVVEL